MTPAETLIRARIAESGALRFDEFMRLALYHPEHGYYMRPTMRTGRQGDFSTSSDVSPAFGQRVAVQLAEVWERLGGGAWRIVELGPGRGLFAGDLLAGLARHAPQAREALTELLLVEISPVLRALQIEHLAAAAPDLPVRHLATLDELAEDPVTGCVIGNEFLDALPVHLVARRDGGRLVERMVSLGEDSELELIDGDAPDTSVAVIVERHELCSKPGQQAEVAIDMQRVVSALDRGLERGAVLMIDYGHEARTLGDDDHADGTLVGYREHRVEFDLLARPGLQDLTAHVNWTHLEELARASSLEPAGRTYQDRFLMALGLTEDLVAPAPPAVETHQQRGERLAARALIMPGAGGGKRFEAAAFVRGIEGPLRGFCAPHL